MSLWVPPAAMREAVDERQAHLADMFREAEMLDTVKRWNRDLKEIDPYLELIKARDDTTLPGLRPGYWHILRAYPGAPPTTIPVEGPNGEFREPDSGLFRELQESDMFNDRVRQAKEKRRKALKKAERRAEEREREDRIEEMKDRVRSAWGTSVSLAPTKRPWTQTANARKG